MVVEALLSPVFALISSLLSLIPDIHIEASADTILAAAQYWTCAAYILPMGTIIAIIGLNVGLQGFRIVVSLIKTIWSLLPIV